MTTDPVFHAALWIGIVGACNVVVGYLTQLGAKRPNTLNQDSKQMFVVGTGISATGILNLFGAAIVASCGGFIDLVLWLHR